MKEIDKQEQQANKASDLISRRQFIEKSGKVIVLGALSSFFLINEVSASEKIQQRTHIYCQNQGHECDMVGCDIYPTTDDPPPPCPSCDNPPADNCTWVLDDLACQVGFTDNE